MNAQKKAYALIRDKIASGEYPGDSPLRPEQIGKVLGVSRMPVREAILQLEAEGLVTIGPNRRPIVTSRTPADIVELFEIRIALESLAAERAVSRMGGPHVAELSGLLGRMEKAAGDPRAWTVLHDAFHDAIYEAAGMPRLLGEIRRLRHSTQPYVLMHINLYTVPEMPGSEHAALIEVVRKRDPDLARSAMADHIRDVAAGIVYRLLRGEASSKPEWAGPQRAASRAKEKLS